MLLPGLPGRARAPGLGRPRAAALRPERRATTEGEYLERIVARTRPQHPDEEWILGGGWSMSVFPGGTPTAAALDRVRAPTVRCSCPTATVTARGSTPQRCAARASTATRPDPADGRIERDADGEPTGTLHEGAMTLVNRLLPEIEPSRADRGAAARPAVPALLRDHGLAGRDHRRLQRPERPRSGLPRRRGIRRADGAGGRRALVGPQRRDSSRSPRSSTGASATAAGASPRRQREDHAGRRRRELHRRDARAVPRRARALHRQLGDLVRRRPRC